MENGVTKVLTIRKCTDLAKKKTMQRRTSESVNVVSIDDMGQ